MKSLALGGLALLTALALRAQSTILNESFVGADRTQQKLPGSIAWNQSPASGNLTVANGALDLAVANGSRDLWAYFPAVSLKIGQSLSFACNFTTTATLTDGLRGVLAFSNGAAQQLGDGPAPTGAYQGYGYFGAGSSGTYDIMKRDGPAAPTSALAASTANIWQAIGNSVAGPLQGSVPYTASISVLRTGADTATISVTFIGGTLNNTATAYDSSGIFTKFDTIGFHLLGATLNGDLLVTSAQLTTASPSLYLISAPAGQIIVNNTTVALTALAGGQPPIAYQWSLGSTQIAGATRSTYVIPGADSSKVGTYSCQITNGGSTSLSPSSTLSVISTANPGRLTNLSVLSLSGTGDQALTVGFVTGGGSGSAGQPLLIRGIGPALSAFGIGSWLTDPQLNVVNTASRVSVVSNAGWASTTINQNQVTAAGTTTFAFPLTDPTSLDAAVVQTLNPGGYSVTVQGKSGDSGQALAEIYDDTTAYTTALPRLVNLSCSAEVNAGGLVTAGFTVGGVTAKTVLIRATGPALAGFGVQGTMPDPQIALHTKVGLEDTVIASNAGWGGDPQIVTVSNSVSAFPLAANSADSVIVCTLPPGSYSAECTSVSGTPGIALIEVYEVP